MGKAPPKPSTASGAVAVIVVLILAGLAANAGFFGQRPDPDLEPGPERERHIIELQVIWMDRIPDEERDWDPEWEEQPTTLVPSDRELTITYYLDDEPHPTQYDHPGTWNEFLAAPIGTRIRLLVEEVSGPSRGQPFKQCTIFEWNQMVAYEHRNDMGDCDVRWTVPD
jgi:hypothetical protein